MGITYTSASVRDARQRTRHVRGGPLFDVRLGLVSAVAVLLVSLAWQGRIALTPAPPHVVNLNAVADARALEPVMRPLFDGSADARLAARELFGFLVQADGARRELPNVGAISRARVPASVIDKASGASGYRERLALERTRATEAARPPVETLPLLTAAQIAQLKPAVVVREPGDARRALLLWCTAYLAGFHLVLLLGTRARAGSDRTLLAIAHLLTAIGLAAMVSRPDPLRDALLFERYVQGILVGLTIAGLLSLVSVRRSQLEQFSWLPLAGAVLLSTILIVFGSGPSGSNAKVNLGPVQPIEAIRVLLALFLAGYFARNWEVLRAVRERAIGSVQLPQWVNVPRLRYVVPVLLGVGFALLLFFLQRDLGPALMLAVVFLATWGIARGRVAMVAAGAALLCAGFYVGYQMEISTTLAARVRIWQSPWDNDARGGDQIAHALWAGATGGPVGAGLGLGDTRYVPAGDTDLVLAGIAEELGIAGVLVVALLFAALVGRAFSTAARAASDYGFFLATILGLFFAVPVLLVSAGLLGIVPLTGVVTPFLSYGGSAMAANFAALGLLAAIRRERTSSAHLQIFRPALRSVTGALALCAAVLVAAAFHLQVVGADEIAIKPHLGVQADGSKRYQYNPRVLDAARLVPRGSILDRNGLPVATDDRPLLQEASADYHKLAIDLDNVCPDEGERCYPFGGRMFHLLGDANARTNWSASNSSFVERDSEARLRGFNDRQTTIRTANGQALTLRRDYSELLPILRHRHQPDHESLKAMLARPREVTLTIDARLQVQVADILARHAARSKTGRAAAVVIDPTTGDLLASASYPWPVSLPQPRSSSAATDALLDRARYGLYPPGSTFKILTAAAALIENPAADRTTFTCSRLPDGRVGARLRGWGRPIRDDVLDTQPHGSVNMHRALVVSCNAYFAQLAMAIGPGPMRATADAAGVTLASGNDDGRVRDTLPQAGYGQGEVLASPLRMARIAAAIAAGGRMPDVRIESTAPAGSQQFLPPDSARRLASFMRDVVVEGTGRSVRGAPVAVAGKTGTAEVTGAASHSWFVGFAPYGAAKSRVAVAVIIENAGYGAGSAAPAAGEIVAAAASLGYAR